MLNNHLDSLPEGLSMALTQNVYAMQYFSGMEDPQRQIFVARAREVHTQEEMQQLVNSLIRH